MKKILSLFIVIAFFTNLDAEVKQLNNRNYASSAISQPLLESEVFHLINQYREANFLPRLRWSSSPANQARKHSLNMANGIVPFGHEGVEVRYATLKKKIPSLTRFGENVAYNFGYSNPAEKAVNGWLASPGHYANIMGDFNLSGVGVAVSEGKYYFTQIFIKADVLPNILDNRDILHEEDYSTAIEIEF